MNAPATRRAFPWTALALAVALLSFAFSARVAMGLRQDLQRLEDRKRTAEEVNALAAEARGLAEAVVASESRVGKAGPADLAPLVKAYLPEDGVKVAPRPAKPFGNAGWTLRESELTFTALDWERLGKFLARAESEPLPWRLVSLSLEGVSDRAGTGKAVLQRLENSGIEPNEAP